MTCVAIQKLGKGWLYKLRDKMHGKSERRYKHSSKTNESIQAGSSFVNNFKIEEEESFYDDRCKDKKKFKEPLLINLQILKT